MNNKRPINLDLRTIHFPITAIVSILHRISGVGLFLIIPILLFFLQKSVADIDSFEYIKSLMSSPWIKLFVWLVLIGVTYHLIAGIRHLLMDMFIGEEKESGRIGAKWVIALTVILSIGLGFWLW